MSRKVLLLVLAFIIGGSTLLPVRAQSDARKQKEEMSNIRSKIAKRGIGPKAKVKLILLDGTKLQGYVSQATPDSFTVVDRRTGGNIVVPFSQVKQLDGSGLSRGAKIGIGLGIGAVAFTVVIGLVNAALDD